MPVAEPVAEVAVAAAHAAVAAAAVWKALSPTIIVDNRVIQQACKRTQHTDRPDRTSCPLLLQLQQVLGWGVSARIIHLSVNCVDTQFTVAALSGLFGEHFARQEGVLDDGSQRWADKHGPSLPCPGRRRSNQLSNLHR
jgi:hypothetical protein